MHSKSIDNKCIGVWQSRPHSDSVGLRSIPNTRLYSLGGETIDEMPFDLAVQYEPLES